MGRWKRVVTPVGRKEGERSAQSFFLLVHTDLCSVFAVEKPKLLGSVWMHHAVPLGIEQITKVLI